MAAANDNIARYSRIEKPVGILSARETVQFQPDVHL